jgi:hypothetical protein
MARIPDDNGHRTNQEKIHLNPSNSLNVVVGFNNCSLVSFDGVGSTASKVIQSTYFSPIYNPSDLSNLLPLTEFTIDFKIETYDPPYLPSPAPNNYNNKRPGFKL